MTAFAPTVGDPGALRAPALRPRSGFDAYFNFGARGPLPPAVLAAMSDAFEVLQAHGWSTFNALDWCEREVELTRAAFARELATQAANIVLTENVSTACGVAIWGIDWEAGDHILVSDCEPPGTLALVREAAERHALEVSEFRADFHTSAEVEAEIASALRRRTRLVVVSHVLWNSGLVLDVAAIDRLRRQRGNGQKILLLVDGAQALGMMPIDVEALGADVYAFTSQKWLCGPDGVAGLFVRPGAADALRATFLGWRSLDPFASRDGLAFHRDCRRFETGTTCVPLLVAARAAIRWQRQAGLPEERHRRLLARREHFLARLDEVAPRVRASLWATDVPSGIVSLRVGDRQPLPLAAQLEARSIVVKPMAPPPSVRICIHHTTSREAIERLAEGLRDAFT